MMMLIGVSYFSILLPCYLLLDLMCRELFLLLNPRTISYLKCYCNCFTCHSTQRNGKTLHFPHLIFWISESLEYGFLNPLLVVTYRIDRGGTSSTANNDIFCLVSDLFNPIHFFHLFLLEVSGCHTYNTNIIVFVVLLYLIFYLAYRYSMIIKCFLITLFRRILEPNPRNIF